MKKEIGIMKQVKQSDRYNLKKILGVLILFVSILLPAADASEFILRIVITSMIYAIAAMGNMLIVGYTGLLTCGHGAFYGLGAYITALLSVKAGFSFLACLLFTLAGAAVFGVLISIPCLRVEEDFLSLITIAFAQIFLTVVKNWKSVTGGTSGVTAIPAPEIFGFSFSSQKSFYYLVLILLLIVYCLLKNLGSSHIGRAMMAVRDDSIGAQAVGINVNKYKILAFAIGSAAGGIGGALIAYYLQYVGPTSFTLDVSFLFMQMIILGGLGSFEGAILGAFFFTIVPEVFRPLAVYRMGLGGLVMLLVVLIRPQGILGTRAFAGKGGIFSKTAAKYFRKKRR